MLNLKKTAVAVLAFGSSAAFAGTMGPVCTPGNVTVPCESTAWDIGIQALYLKPSFTDGLAWLGATVTPDGTVERFYDTTPRWHWGFKLEGSYHFSTGNDLNLNWYHLGSNNRTRRYAAGFDVFGLGEAGAFGSFSARPRWDAVNLEFGQHVDVGEFKNIRFHGGVQYARIKAEVSHYGTATFDGSIFGPYNAYHSSSYNGFGPRVGADMSYDWGNGLAMYANGAMAILAGTSKLSAYRTDFVFGPLYRSGSKTTIVPEVEAKLGLTYTWPMAQGDFSVDGGWMFVNYFNPLLHSYFDIAVHDTDFGVQGPFLGLKWVGSVV